MTIPEWFFKEEQSPMKKKKVCNPKSKQRARNNNKLDDKDLEKELAKKMINPYYFTNENLKIGFKINL